MGKSRVLFVLLTLLLSGCAKWQGREPMEDNYQQLALLQQSQAEQLKAQQQLLEDQVQQLAVLNRQLQLQSKQQTDVQQQLQQFLGQSRNSAQPAVYTSAPVIKPSSCNVDGKLLLGSAEWVWLKPAGKALRARIDTGASTSSIGATNIELFERDGKNWVRFHILDQGKADIAIESPLIRTVKIRQASIDTSERRYVVRLPLRIGEFVEEAQFTLSDRAKMSYPLLLGREFLRDVAVVDVARKYIQPKPSAEAELGYLSEIGR